MHAAVNRQVVLASRPTGIPQAEHFAIVENAPPVPGPAQVLVRNIFLSVEPAMRGWVADVGNYSAPVEIGAVMRARSQSDVSRPRKSPATQSVNT